MLNNLFNRINTILGEELGAVKNNRRYEEEVVIIDAEYTEVQEEATKEVPVLEAPATEDRPVADTNTKEEKHVVEEKKQEFDEEGLVATLIASGVDPEVAKATAANVAQQKKEAAKEEPTKKEEKEVEKKDNAKPWFKRAVDKLTAPRKNAFIGQLAMQKAQSKDPKEQAEIQAEIDKLTAEGGDERFKKLMNGYIIKAKGWTVDASGQIAEFAYLTGDGVEKFTTKATKAVGKGMQWTGEKITSGGKSVENNAEKAGKVARKPFDAVGDGINVLNGNKKVSMPKSSKNKK